MADPPHFVLRASIAARALDRDVSGFRQPIAHGNRYQRAKLHIRDLGRCETQVLGDSVGRIGQGLPTLRRSPFHRDAVASNTDNLNFVWIAWHEWPAQDVFRKAVFADE